LTHIVIPHSETAEHEFNWLNGEWKVPSGWKACRKMSWSIQGKGEVKGGVEVKSGKAFSIRYGKKFS